MSGTGSGKPVTGSSSDNLDNLTELNRAAWNALLGMSACWENDLIALLRSDEPIHCWVRSALASLIAGESETGLSLKMSGHKALRDSTVAIESRRKWVRIGEIVALCREHGATRERAKQLAVYAFAASEETCDAAIDYRNRYRRWRDALQADHPFFAIMSEDGIECAFHQMVHEETPLDSPDGLELARRYVAFVTS